MKAIVLAKFGGLDSLVMKDMPDPKEQEGHVLIEVKAFGINHAEMHMRKGEWAEAAAIIGIECVGIVTACPGGEFIYLVDLDQDDSSTRMALLPEALRPVVSERIGQNRLPGT